MATERSLFRGAATRMPLGTYNDFSYEARMTVVALLVLLAALAVWMARLG